LSELDDMDIVDEDDIRTKGAPNEWVFSLKPFVSSPILFCAIDEAEMDIWVDEMTQRIRAYRRIKFLEKPEQTTPSSSSSANHGQPTIHPPVLSKKSRIKMEVNKMKESIANRKRCDTSPR